MQTGYCQRSATGTSAIWSAPAKRSGDGALNDTGAVELSKACVPTKALRRFRFHSPRDARPSRQLTSQRSKERLDISPQRVSRLCSDSGKYCHSEKASGAFFNPGHRRPPLYQGNEIEPTHAGMHIGNPEFDAAIGDLKASLDKLRIPNKEQKERLSIIERTRPQIVTERQVESAAPMVTGGQ